MGLAKMLLILLFVANVFADELINNNNWISHPKIIKIRGVCDEIEKLDKNGKLRFERKECDPEGLSDVAFLLIDSDSIIRKYIINYGGSGDQAAHAEYFYDKKGVLRFAYSYCGSVSGSVVEYRIYYNEKGKHIFTNHKDIGSSVSCYSDPPELINNPREHIQNMCNVQ